MSYIKIPRVSASSVPTPEAGKYVLFSNVDKSGHLFAKDQDGNSFDLTEATNSLFNVDNITTQFKVNELNRTITSSELLSMSHENFTNPTGGIELLPAPGAGKCYIIAMDGIFANYISNSNWGYKANPVGENRSLDVYYPKQGTTTKTDSNKIFSIPLFYHNYSDFVGSDRYYASDKIGSTADAFWRSQNQESLCIDTKSNSVIYQQQNTNSSNNGFGAYSIVNQPLYIGTNGFLAKQMNSTDGELSIRLWYSIIDISDIYTEPSEANPLEDYYFSNKVRVLPEDNKIFFTAINFLDNPLIEPPISYWEDLPDPTTSGYNIEDFYITYRSRCDEFIKANNEYSISKANGTDGFYRTGSGIRDIEIKDLTLPPTKVYGSYYSGPWFGYRLLDGPGATQFGFPLDDINPNVIPARVPFYDDLDGFFYNRLPYDVSDGTRCFIEDPNNSWTFKGVFDANCGRVNEIQIVSGGTGYSAYDELVMTGGTSVSTTDTGEDARAYAIVKRVSSTGEILEVSFTNKGKFDRKIFGGYYYTSAPTVGVTGSLGTGAVLTATISNGQWVDEEDIIRDTDFGDTNFYYIDVMTTQRATRDAWIKSMYEITRADTDFLLACLYLPQFQLEKYHL